MNGTVYFKDGHTEDILELRNYVGTFPIQFKTESGRYLYDDNVRTFYKRFMINDPTEGIIPVYLTADYIDRIKLKGKD